MGAVITLTTDFGTRDGYVGALKGVMLAIAPRAHLVDITHQIEPGNVAQAAFVLEGFHALFPAGTVHLAVVDPWVGTSRKPLAVDAGGRFYVGPDNGVFEPVFRASPGFACYELADSRYHRETVSRTFHGRDIFAPVAAHLACGVPPGNLGPRVEKPRRLKERRPEKNSSGEDRLIGRVIHVDRFGNLITDITAEKLDSFAQGSDLRISICGITIDGLSRYYAQAPPGGLIALGGGTGRLEVAVSLGSAAQMLGGAASGADLTIIKKDR